MWLLLLPWYVHRWSPGHGLTPSWRLLLVLRYNAACMLLTCLGCSVHHGHLLCCFDCMHVAFTLNLALHCCMVTSPGLARCLGLVTRSEFRGWPPLALNDKDRQVCRGSA